MNTAGGDKTGSCLSLGVPTETCPIVMHLRIIYRNTHDSNLSIGKVTSVQ